MPRAPWPSRCSPAYTGPLVFTPVNNGSGFWNFTATSYRVGQGATTDQPLSAIADTGTTLMYLPTAAVEAYYAQVPGSENSSSAGGWVFPCDAANPDFSFGVDYNMFTVPAQFINYQAIDDTNCFGGIQDDSDIGFSIFGDVALKGFYVVFDSDGPQLGWAAKKTE
ncbi:hypothetical protein P8C59_005640 [Phyllachora maydis]|uniref:Peptidase A1 domain-containing protein n=1 Tax=Phyllachora maydis TaxID=1825666 RepID=A0AAD9I4U9_9PEZI|nr:hypothetical protein P8C59_005640 [Phyllachora maydis]